MAPIRVLLAQLSDDLQDYFQEALAGHADLRLVGSFADPIDVLLAVGQTEAEVVVLGVADASIPAIATHLVDEYPDVKLLGVTPDRQRAFLYELCPRRIPIGELSAGTLAEVIRIAVHPEVGQ